MNSNNQLYKKIGILLSIVAVLAVAIVTYSEENKSSNVSSTDTTSQQVTTGTTNQPVSTVSDDSASPSPSDSPTQNPAPVQTTAPAVTSAPVTTKKAASTNQYKNGTYTAQGSYGTPEGNVAINVTITLTNDVITDANVTSASGDRTSVRYQNKFISGYKQYVVGKSISSVQLSKVSGSSLTPEGFNNALAQIKQQAAA